MTDVSFKILKGNSIYSDGSNEEALMRRLLKLVWEGEREQTRDDEVRSGKVTTLRTTGTGRGNNANRAP